jgi:hypothetical protein
LTSRDIGKTHTKKLDIEECMAITVDHDASLIPLPHSNGADRPPCFFKTYSLTGPYLENKMWKNGLFLGKDFVIFSSIGGTSKTDSLCMLR